MDYKIIDFQYHGDERGKLIVLEQRKEIPFDMKRIYYIFDTLQDVRRGFHAHKQLQQVLICIHGSCKILLDDGKRREIIELNDCSKGLFLYKPMWREMYDFSEGAVLAVIASDYYTEKDYIRDYDTFLEYIEERKLIEDKFYD